MLVVQRLDGRIHDREGFDCGEPALNRYLQGLATQHHRAGVATTHVLVEQRAPSQILGYYSLAAAQMSLAELTAALVTDATRVIASTANVTVNDAAAATLSAIATTSACFPASG